MQYQEPRVESYTRRLKSCPPEQPMERVRSRELHAVFIETCARTTRGPLWGWRATSVRSSHARSFFPRHPTLLPPPPPRRCRCERAGQYDVALRLLDEMRKKRMRFYDIGILDELFKRLLAGLSLLRGRRAAAAAARSPVPPPSKRGDGGGDGDGSGGGGERT